MSNQKGSLEEIQETTPQSSIHVQSLIDLKEKVRDRYHQHQYQYSICMVPSYLRDVNPSCYKPQVVSIGPLHKDDENLKEFEDEKATCLHYVINRSRSSPEQLLASCLQKVNASIFKIRACYVGMKTYTDDELAKMMVIDAFFILEFFLGTSRLVKFIEGNKILSNAILFDLLLLENQIPFFVLQDIFECILIDSMQTPPDLDSMRTFLISHILRLLKNIKIFSATGNDVIDTTPDHILGLMQKMFHPKDITSSSDQSSQQTYNSSLELESFVGTHHSVLDLDKAGVKFKPNKDENWQMAMEFQSSSVGCFSWWGWSNTSLRMPKMFILDYTEKVLRNIIAYEQCTPGVPEYMSSYVCAIDDLVDNDEDLAKLVESKVMMNLLGSIEEATNLINNICKHVVFEELYYKEQWQQLDQYYNGYWPRNIVWLKRRYFNNPWTIIALLATFILFGLTITQTIFTIKGACAK